MVDILDMLEEAEWTVTRQGRQAEPSPYLPAVLKSWTERAKDSVFGKSFAFPINVGKGSPETQDAELNKHVNLLRKAGRQVTAEQGGPVTVLVQAGDVARKSGDVRVQFITREKIVQKRDETPAEAPSAA